MQKKILLVPCNCNPPPAYLAQLLFKLAADYRVIVIPSGSRAEKEALDDVANYDRATMADLTFHGIPGVEIDLFDLEQPTFTPTHALVKRYAGEGEVTLLVGSELIAGGRGGCSRIQSEWKNGNELWQHTNFLVMEKAALPALSSDLPPHGKLWRVGQIITGELIRGRVHRGESIDGLVVPAVANYIHQHRLYKNGEARRTIELKLDDPRPLIYADSWNERAVALAEELRYLERPDPNFILVLGGDGTMIRAVQQHWRMRLPFFGLNLGHLGYLLNDRRILEQRFDFRAMSVHQIPLLRVDATLADGDQKSILTLNDAYAKEASDQAARIEVRVNDEVIDEALSCDTIALSTPAGSTGYTDTMGGPLVPIGDKQLVLAALGFKPRSRWARCPVKLYSFDDRISWRSAEADKRQLLGFASGLKIGICSSMSMQMSRAVAVELAFTPGLDLNKKRRLLQLQNE